MFTLTLLLLFVVTNEVLTIPLPLSVHLPELQGSVISAQKNCRGNEEQLVQLRESDKNLLRAVALFFGILLVFSLFVCVCTMYWCICWSSNCPGSTIVRSIIRGTRQSSVLFRITRSCSGEGKSKRRGALPDPPPAYEVILSECNTLDELPPPTYTEALMHENTAI